MVKAKTPSNKPAANKGQGNPAKASPLPTPQTPAPAPAKAVALRGGAAVGNVVLTPKLYRTAAPHNVQWWQTITAACAKTPNGTPVGPMLVSPSNPHGVPAAFVGYVLRRGYLQAV